MPENFVCFFQKPPVCKKTHKVSPAIPLNHPYRLPLQITLDLYERQLYGTYLEVKNMDRLSLTMELTNRTEMQQRLIVTPKIKIARSKEQEEAEFQKLIKRLNKLKTT